MARKPKYQREDDLIERLEKENRELKSLSKSLQKRLKKVSKGYNNFIQEDGLEESNKALETLTKELNKICYDCGGNYKKYKLVNREYRLCDGCGKRSKAKIATC